ncbi:FliH/SctL family protein [Succinivibrio sp.]|uniref:FliH/SctL family protein n=1 Tax=Succinivibrio sp. TaxID=2053619 RepID=UPI0025E0F006|nr:FliH/SctL family protein [Succinivibrio sp.]MBQ9219969.1 hypothetical protein [Succinivibrio sp.]
MSDFFHKNASSAEGDVANASDIANEKPNRVDIRYDKKIATVTSASKVSNYKVKVWPTLSDDFVTGTNALGMNVEMVERKRAFMRLEKKRNDYLEEVALILDAHKILEEEEAADRAAHGITSITLEEVEKIRNDAYEEGKSQGHDEGYQIGFDEGKTEGIKQGHEEGLAIGKEEGYASGLEQGKADGFEKGHDEGLESGQKVVLEQVERFRFLADSLANPLREVDKEVTDEIAYIISRLAKVIIKKEIDTNAEFLKKSIEQAISILPSATKGVSIYLNPEDYAVINAAIGNDYIKEQGWDLKESDKLSPGDIRVVNDNSEINWRINDRIDSLLEDFLAKVYPNVDSALRESIDGCPEYNELPKKALAPRNLNDISDVLKSKAQTTASAEVTPSEPQEALDQDNLAQTMQQQAPLTDDPAPYVDDFGHPVYQSPDGQLYYFDENNNRVYVDENGVPIGSDPVAEAEVTADVQPGA